ncbi:reverse transcriptase family protein [Roseateles amylovorans]|uniref:RNA-directed DNA polymerase n=1 Tax=Roseateles amylovorans TaxID=2978473 RepID=A0ABY6B4B8_9BURK|nr:reverse transcriptase family protein [Roseateles amylovorans]UXH79571.1 reverse transcriptase family protein [Roseateles amylovorans]
MSDRVPTRADIIERIRASSKDAVVLQEMQRLGFWPSHQTEPTLEAALIEREAVLMKALQEAQSQLRQINDPEAALKAMRRERMAAALARREATAQAREQRRFERAQRWHEARKTDAGYLGAGVSGGLQPPAQQGERRPLSEGLPPLASPMALAQAMCLTLPELKFLCFHREVARTTHYRRFQLPKKTGGQRTISAPMPRLKRAQYWVLDNLLAKVKVHSAAHGFLPGRSILTNATPHVGQEVVINLDIQDFFPTITYPRIKGVFIGLGYDEPVATLLALMCSENPCDELVVDGERFYVGGKGRDRVLPQGAPTSPMLTNVLCRKMDRRLQGLADKLGFAYTRYADDLTFSASGDAAGRVGTLLRQARHVLKDEGFTPHPAKQHVMRSGARQAVTGVVVNDKPSVSRQQRRELRAALHKASREGVEAATWQGQPATREVLVGYSRFVSMVDRTQGAPLLAQALGLSGGGSARRSGFGEAFRRQAAQGQAPVLARGGWWQPAEPPAPVLQQTAAQQKAARLARQAEQRAARQPAASATPNARPDPRHDDAAAPQSGQDAASPASVTPVAPGAVPWVRYAVQFAILASFGESTMSPVVLLGGLLHLAIRIKTGERSWWQFLLGLGVLLMVDAAIRRL